MSIALWQPTIASSQVAFDCAEKLPTANLPVQSIIDCLRKNERELASFIEQFRQADSERAVLRASAVPSGTIAWFNRSTCPSNWTSAGELTGRYAVGVEEGGRVGLTVGQALTSGEDRASGRHNHTYRWVDPAGNPGPRGGLEAGGGVGREYQSGDTSDGRVPVGTNAPYVQLLACRKE